MSLEVFCCWILVLAAGTIMASQCVFNPRAGVIGEPNHEVIVEPREEPIPKTTPAPQVPEPVQPLAP
jgi:hypothetical protein